MKTPTIITYEITAIEEPITKAELMTLKKFLGEFTLRTNAGIDIHSSEIKGGEWKGCKIERLKSEPTPNMPELGTTEFDDMRGKYLRNW
jgi:hypothetical protein